MGAVAALRKVKDGETEYTVLAFVCPGCIEMGGGSGLHMLPVNADGRKSPSWGFDGNLEAPTLTPSILTHRNTPDGERRCHSYIRAGVIEYLGDSTHSMAGTNVPLPELPDWVTKLDDGGDRDP